MKFKSILKNIFNIFFIIVFGYIMKVSIFDARVFRELSPSIIVLSVLLLLVLYLIFRYILDKVSNKVALVINVLIYIILIAIQLMIIKKLVVNPSWDFNAISTSGKTMATMGEIPILQYFNQYPNNLGASVFLSFVYKLVFKYGISVEKYVLVGMLLNIIIIDLSLILGCILMWIDRGYKAATLFSFSALFITPLYMYAPIFYTDTLSMIYPIILALLYYLYKKTNKNILLIISAVFIAIGVLIKTNVVIAILALCIYSYLTSDFKEYSKVIIISIVSLIIVNTTFNFYLEDKYDLHVKDMGFPATHWVMMGLKNSGGYDHDDVIFTLNTEPDKRKDENIRVIKERLNNFGLYGLVKHLDGKIKVTWGDGSLYAPSKLKRYPVYEGNLLSKYIYGEKNQFYLYISQASFVIIIIGILLSSIKSIRNKNISDIENLFNISIFGVFLFLLIWETRSRYLVCFLVIMMISSIIGLDYLYNKLKNLLYKWTDKEYFRIKKVTS